MKKYLFLIFILSMASQCQADTFTITVSTTVGTRIKNAFGTAYNYQVNLSSANGQQYANPESLAQFTLRKVKEYVKSVTVAVETQAAADTSRTAQSAQSNIDIVVP